MRDDTRITFHPLTFRRLGTESLVGYEAGGKYLTVDDNGVAVITQLQTQTVGDVKRAYPEHDIEDIIAQLCSHGLVHRIDHRIVSDTRPLMDVLQLPTSALRWVHYPITYAIVAIIVFTGIVLLTQKTVWPGPYAFFLTGWYGALIPTAFITWWVLQALHELGHYIALQATGHPAGYRITKKWHFLLPAADINNARLLSRRKRIFVHLAGIAVDLTIATIAGISILLGWHPAFWSFILVLIVIDILFQAAPVHDTDLMRAAEHWLGVERLPHILKRYVQTACPRCRKTVELPVHERRAAEHVLPYAIAGMVIGAIALFGYVIPILIELVTESVKHLILGATLRETAFFVDGLLALMLMSVFISFFTVSMIREHHLNARDWFAWMNVTVFLLSNFIVVFLLSAALILYASPAATSAALFFIGIAYGVFFLRLLEHISVHKTGFARDFFLPVMAASTALLLMIATIWIAAATQTIEPQAIYAVAYGAGMISAIVF